ncbi:calcium-binding protein [Synechocystis sp. CACIAM 05]|uniref:calcium-binding protein n=1 Tax=Synechocystis sp. CACIAM 05 TaxID=1933929 RepID=UPI00138E6D1A|nr:calcium-binding protein [Synechocystis sp. CACIAM 05]QHU99091.1 hypothetical protein BWK47_02430 [Synechocystis sp. CACIAM 05]
MALINGTNSNDNNTFNGPLFPFFFKRALIGTGANDTIKGLAGNDILAGQAGDDSLDGGSGADTMFGGLGNDTYVVDNPGDLVGELPGGGTDLVLSSVSYSLDTPASFSLPPITGIAENIAAALPQFLGGLGSDYFPYLGLTKLSLTPQQIENLTLTGTTGFETIDGTGNALDNIITGNNGDNKLYGLAGKDTIYGMGGNDTLYGGLDSDSLYGDKGNDSVFGEAGNDTLYGGEGSDTMDGGADTDTVDYGALVDSVPVAQTITLKGTGDLNLTVEKGPLGTDKLLNIEKIIANAAAKNNTIDFSGANSGITINVDLSLQSILISGASSPPSLVSVVNFDDVIGTDGNDTITGDDQDNLLKGGSGNDTIYGGNGKDTIYGDDGDDVIYGNNSPDLIYGGKGNDIIYGDNAPDLIYGDEGDDTIFGNTAKDTIYGGSGKDIINGGNGEDLISGGADKDILTGDSGGDVFDYKTLTDSRLGLSWFNVNLSKVDVITDFIIGQDRFLVQQVPTNGFLPGVLQLNVNSILGLGATILGLATLGSFDAAQINVGSGPGARTFVAINNGSVGFNPNTDAFVELTNFTGSLSVSDFTTTV